MSSGLPSATSIRSTAPFRRKVATRPVGVVDSVGDQFVNDEHTVAELTDTLGAGDTRCSGTAVGRLLTALHPSVAQASDNDDARNLLSSGLYAWMTVMTSSRTRGSTRRTGPRHEGGVPAQEPVGFVQCASGHARLETEGAEELIDEMSEKYFGMKYPFRALSGPRVTIRVTPTKVIYMGGMEKNLTAQIKNQDHPEMPFLDSDYPTV